MFRCLVKTFFQCDDFWKITDLKILDFIYLSLFLNLRIILVSIIIYYINVCDTYISFMNAFVIKICFRRRFNRDVPCARICSRVHVLILEPCSTCKSQTLQRRIPFEYMDIIRFFHIFFSLYDRRSCAVSCFDIL